MWFLLTTRPANRFIYAQTQIASMTMSVVTHGSLPTILKSGQSHVMIRYSLYIIRGYQLPTLKKPILTEAIDKSSMNWKMEAQ